MGCLWNLTYRFHAQWTLTTSVDARAGRTKQVDTNLRPAVELTAHGDSATINPIRLRSRSQVGHL
jgi:hypothetical protein